MSIRNVRFISVVCMAMVLSSIVTVPSPVKPVYAWWDVGHTIVTSRAIPLMPDTWKSFLSYYEFYLNETSVYPDSVYKNLDPKEEYRHYIDLEIWHPRKPETGTLPFAVEQFAGEAVQAMKASDWNKGFYLLGRVSHYVADIHQPYHSTVDYNPKTKAGKPLHPILDAAMQVHFKELKVVTADDVKVLEPVQNITLFCFQIAWQSHSFLQRMNQILIDEEKEWSPELTKIVENRTNSAIVAVARIWYTITLRAGASPPQIPKPNVLTVSLIGINQEFDPDKETTLRIVVTDKIGICTPAVVRASWGNQPLAVHEFSYIADPLGKYSVSLTSSMLSQFKGRDVSLFLTAERPGYVSSRFETTVKVGGTSPQFIQIVVIVCSVVAGVVVVGAIYLRKGRKKVVTQEQAV